MIGLARRPGSATISDAIGWRHEPLPPYRPVLSPRARHDRHAASQRPMWHDPAAHAREFAGRYAEPLNYHVENRMMELGIDPLKIGVGDPEHSIRHAAFIPHEVDGGGNTPEGRLNLDSGILNPDLFKRLGPEASAPTRRLDCGTGSMRAS